MHTDKCQEYFAGAAVLQGSVAAWLHSILKTQCGVDMFSWVKGLSVGK